jgi:rhodanese-related sulfurtransferase
VLALVGVMLGTGCSGGNGDSGADQDAGGQPAVRAAPTAGQTSPLVMTSAELMERLDGPDAPVILDVRSPEEYAEGHIPGAINIPYDQIGAQVGSLEHYRERDLVVYCRTGRRAGVAEDLLSQAGFEQIWDLEGHMVAWQEAELPVAVPAVN